ncbi:hypothetical protein IJC60_01305 [bacterium]|nr:hypothetical protein [bacterium]
MENISEILKEAKPLYIKRKKEQATAKYILSVMFTAFLVGSFTVGINAYDEQIANANYETSIIEEMGLPVDEYGLLSFEY